MTPRSPLRQSARDLFGPAHLWLVPILVVYVAHVYYLNCVAEDAFITFRFARNLASGQGLVWNPGEAPVEGYTNFLWLLLTAGAMKLGLAAPLFTQLLGTTVGSATIVLAYATGRRLAGWSRGLALVPALMLAASGPFATWSGSGMETVLFTGLVLAGVFAFGAYWQTGRPSAMIAMSLALFAATLTRPEGVMVFCLLIGLSLILSAGEFRQRLGHHAFAAACWGILFAIYFVWRYSYFGYVLPNTFYAKTGGGLDQLKRGTILSAQFAWQFVAPLVPWALVGAWETGAPRLGHIRFVEVVALLRRQALMAACLLVVVVYATYIVLVGDDYMAMHRFFVPLLPLIYLLASSALAPLAARVTAERSRLTVVAALVGMAAVATAFHSTPYEELFVAKPAQQHGNYQGVQTERWAVARLTLIGKFFAGYRQSPQESLGTNGIGCIGYFGDLAVLDYHGLVDVHIARSTVPAYKLRGLAGHQKADYPYILAKKPTYLMFSRELTLESGDLERFAPRDVWPLVQQDYVVRSVRLTDTVNHESGYFSFLERRDHSKKAAEGSLPR